MPLGIPVNLTTEIPYRAGIVYPVAGEFGRMETIEIMGLEGRDYAERCDAPNLGILAVRFEVDRAENAIKELEDRGATLEAPLRRATVPPYGDIRLFDLKTPDGEIVQFFSRGDG